MNKPNEAQTSLIGRESLVLEQSLRSIFNLGQACGMIGRVYTPNGEEFSSVTSSKSTMDTLAVKRRLPKSFLLNAVEKISNTREVEIIKEDDNSNSCVFCSIFIHNVFVAFGVIFEVKENAHPAASNAQLKRIGILMRQLIELAKHQAGRNIDFDEEILDVIQDEKTSLFELSKANLPMLRTLMGPEEFSEKLRQTLTEEGIPRLLALTIMHINIDIENDTGSTATGRARLELLDSVISRLSGSMRDADLLSYLPDGNFALLISPIPTVTLASSIFNRTFNAMGQPVVRNGKLYRVSVSAGISLLKSRPAATHKEILECIAHSRVLLEKAMNENSGNWIMEREEDRAD